jgi:methyltransferase (TIGR00027 family)
MTEPLIRDVSDTARWMAVYRARESERPDAVFRDPYARALAGDRGERIAAALGSNQNVEWSVVARTYAFDRYITKEIAAGADLVISLAAGLDTRPYRLALPPSLRWVEVDLPEILEYKEAILADAKPACAVERVPLDLTNYDARRGLFADLGRRASRAAVISEGLVIYLMPDEVGALAHDLAQPAAFRRWIVDIVSPALLTMIDEQSGAMVRQAGAPFLFAPTDGPAFFERFGWQPITVRSLLKTAASLSRLPVFLRLMAMLPEGNAPYASHPWSGVVLLGRGSA